MHSTARNRPSVSTRTTEFSPRELPLSDGSELQNPPTFERNRASSRIREALRRWFDQEL